LPWNSSGLASARPDGTVSRWRVAAGVRPRPVVGETWREGEGMAAEEKDAGTR